MAREVPTTVGRATPPGQFISRRDLDRIEACLALVFLAVATWGLISRALAAADLGDLGTDFLVYRQNGADWLASGQLYFPEQLAGPYANVLGHSVYYPPHALILFVPFGVLPMPLAALLWWGIPAALVVLVIRRFRPAPWSWPLMGLILAWPRTPVSIVAGNTDLWVLAFVAGGLLWGWPAVLVTIKPAFLPLSLVGIHRRGWWAGGLLVGAATLGFGMLWLDYLTIMRNAQGLDLGYRLVALPLMLLPLVARIGSARLTRETLARASALGGP